MNFEMLETSNGINPCLVMHTPQEVQMVTALLGSTNRAVETTFGVGDFLELFLAITDLLDQTGLGDYPRLNTSTLR